MSEPGPASSGFASEDAVSILCSMGSCNKSRINGVAVASSAAVKSEKTRKPSPVPQTTASLPATVAASAVPAGTSAYTESAGISAAPELAALQAAMISAASSTTTARSTSKDSATPGSHHLTPSSVASLTATSMASSLPSASTAEEMKRAERSPGRSTGSRTAAPLTAITAAATPRRPSSASSSNSNSKSDGCNTRGCAGLKQHQLPMFLSKTYHMIDKCDAAIATWSASGDSFVVKNVDLFSTTILPMYFKHSNFSSFARQLNFYGFRKLRADPILTNDVDPSTAGYVRFYHEKFQRDRADLLHQIKRATKSGDPGPSVAKDEVDSMKAELTRTKDCITAISCEMDRRLTEMTFDYNHRIANLTAENDRLSSIVMTLWDAHHRKLYEEAAQADQQARIDASSTTAVDPAVVDSEQKVATLPALTPPAPTTVVSAAPPPTPSMPTSAGLTVSSESLQAARDAERRMQSLSHAVALNLAQSDYKTHVPNPHSPPRSIPSASLTSSAATHHISSLLQHMTGGPTPTPASTATAASVASIGSTTPTASSAAVAAAALSNRHQQVLAAAAAAEAAAAAATATAEAGMSSVKHEHALTGTKRKAPDGS